MQAHATPLKASCPKRTTLMTGLVPALALILVPALAMALVLVPSNTLAKVDNAFMQIFFPNM
ncbi:MAG: hypothetical protein GY710_27015 [Desulfobacteraceae bacterium]|nr:hypothetical protein [Desulfobacteraceae bacterium]